MESATRDSASVSMDIRVAALAAPAGGPPLPVPAKVQERSAAPCGVAHFDQ